MSARLCWALIALFNLCLVSPSLAQSTQASKAEQSAKSWPERLGPFELSPSSGTKLGLGFATQLRTTLTNEGDSKLGGSARDTHESVELRRVRVSLRASFLDERLKFFAQFSLASSSPEMVDIWGELAIRPALRLRVGQQKIPFTRHRGQSFTILPMPDWDIASVRFGAERQIGLQVHDNLRGGGHFNYSLGVFSGANARTAFARGVPEVYGEPMPSRSSFRSAPADTPIHPEIAGMFGFSSQGMDPAAPTDPEGGAPRCFVGASGAWDLRPERGQDFAVRAAPEILLKAYHLSLDLIGYAGWFDPARGPASPGMLGLTSELTYRFRPALELSARYSRTDTSSSLRRDARQHAASLIAAAAADDLARLQEQYSGAGKMRSQQEYALGFNVYIVGRSLAWQSDVAWLRTDWNRASPVQTADQIRARSQVQLAF
jgi:hypothetical protein